MKYAILNKPAKSNKQIQEYLPAVDKGITGRFVMQNGKGWYLCKLNSRTGKLFITKNEAVAKAKQELAKTDGELFIFDRAGQLIARQ